MHEITILVAKYFIIIPVIAVLVLAWRLNNAKRWQLLGTVVLGGILSLVLAKLGSHVFYDTRPFVAGHLTPLIPHAPDNGFPSDHTLLGAFLAYVVLRYSRPWGLGLLVVAALIGLSRVAAHVHHLLDIAGSFVIAGIGYLLAVWAITAFVDRRSGTDTIQ